MTFEVSLRLQRTVHGLFGRAVETFPQVDSRAGTSGEGEPQRPVFVVKRSIDPRARRDIILGTVLGSVGLAALVVCVFILSRYRARRRRETADEKAMAASMVIEPPSLSIYESRRKPEIDVPPPPPPKATYYPQRIINHPYASPYSRDVDLPAVSPSTPPAAEPRSTARRPQRNIAPLASTSHPYSSPSRRDAILQPQPSADPSQMTYESFMSPLDASPSPQQHSPLASTTGGAESSLGNRATTFSNLTADSSTPLQPRRQYSQRH